MIKNFLFLLLFTYNLNYPQSGFGPQADITAESFLSFEKVQTSSQLKVALKVTIGKDWHINSIKPKDEFLIPTEFKISSLEFEVEKTSYPQAEEIKLDFSEELLSVYEGEVYFGALLKMKDGVKPGKYFLVVSLYYQACDNATCLPPAEIIDTLFYEIVGNQTPVIEINQNIFEKVDLSYSSISAPQKDEDLISSQLEKSGLFLSLFLVFLGGLALNLTPCVYPLIPITIGYFGGQSEGSTGRLALMGLFYLLGIALTYSVVGVVTALSGAVFGALLQNPIVIIIIAAIFVLLSLSMFGAYEFRLPNFLVSRAGGAKGGLYGAFFMGLTMGIVAAPCIGPFVLGLVTYVAAKGDAFNGFLLFFFLAVGLGAPYFILAIFSGKIKSLPKAGEWMEAVKHIFGFLLIGMAIYFVNPLLPKKIAEYSLPVYMILTGTYLIFFEKFGDKIKAFKIFKLVFSFLAIAAAVYWMYPAETNSIDWQPYKQEIFTQAKADGKKILIDFYADWCIPCKELDALTFSNDKVIAESESFVNLKADLTKTLSPEVDALRQQFSIVGVPTVLVIDSQGNEVERITGFLNAEEFLKILQTAN